MQSSDNRLEHEDQCALEISKLAGSRAVINYEAFAPSHLRNCVGKDTVCSTFRWWLQAWAIQQVPFANPGTSRSCGDGS